MAFPNVLIDMQTVAYIYFSGDWTWGWRKLIHNLSLTGPQTDNGTYHSAFASRAQNDVLWPQKTIKFGAISNYDNFKRCQRTVQGANTNYPSTVNLDGLEAWSFFTISWIWLNFVPTTIHAGEKKQMANIYRLWFVSVNSPFILYQVKYHFGIFVVKCRCILVVSTLLALLTRFGWSDFSLTWGVQEAWT